MAESNDRRSRRPKVAPASQRTAAPGSKSSATGVAGVASGPAVTAATTLADAIAGRLIEQGLIGDERRAEVARGLASGTLDVGSWKVLAEVTLEAAARGSKL